MYVCMYVCMCVCMNVCMCVYVSINECFSFHLAYVYQPYNAPSTVLAAAGVNLGTTYPHPVVSQTDCRERSVTSVCAEYKRAGSADSRTLWLMRPLSFFPCQLCTPCSALPR